MKSKKAIKFAHLIQDAVERKHLDTESLGKRLDLSFWSARTLRWGDRMRISDRLLQKCIKKLQLPPRTATRLASEQNIFSKKVTKKTA
jgi:hypothetical protein